MKTAAQFISERLKAMEMSERGLADLLDISHMTVNRYVNGESRVPLKIGAQIYDLLSLRQDFLDQVEFESTRNNKIVNEKRALRKMSTLAQKSHTAFIELVYTEDENFFTYPQKYAEILSQRELERTCMRENTRFHKSLIVHLGGREEFARKALNQHIKLRVIHSNNNKVILDIFMNKIFFFDEKGEPFEWDDSGSIRYAEYCRRIKIHPASLFALAWDVARDRNELFEAISRGQSDFKPEFLLKNTLKQLNLIVGKYVKNFSTNSEKILKSLKDIQGKIKYLVKTPEKGFSLDILLAKTGVLENFAISKFTSFTK